jgi:hypothetical protein
MCSVLSESCGPQDSVPGLLWAAGRGSHSQRLGLHEHCLGPDCRAQAPSSLAAFNTPTRTPAPQPAQPHLQDAAQPIIRRDPMSTHMTPFIKDRLCTLPVSARADACGQRTRRGSTVSSGEPNTEAGAGAWEARNRMRCCKMRRARQHGSGMLRAESQSTRSTCAARPRAPHTAHMRGRSHLLLHHTRLAQRGQSGDGRGGGGGRLALHDHACTR